MNQSRKDALRQTAVIAIGQAIGLGIMLGIYALVDAFSVNVLLSGVIGSVLGVLNFFAMALIATLAADKAQEGDVAGGKKMMKGAYPVRMIVLAAILVVLAKFGTFNVIALVVPVAFVPITALVWSFFQKKGA